MVIVPQWQELDLVRRFEPDGDKEGSPCRLACVADSRSEVEMDPSIPVTTHILPKQTFEERQQQLLPLHCAAFLGSGVADA